MLFPKKVNHKRKSPKQSLRGEFNRSLRKEIYERDNGLCRQCGKQGSEIHHCKFRSSGGRGVLTNGVLLCNRCHVRVHRIKEEADKWRRIMEVNYGADYYKDEWDI